MVTLSPDGDAAGGQAESDEPSASTTVECPNSPLKTTWVWVKLAPPIFAPQPLYFGAGSQPNLLIV